MVNVTDSNDNRPIFDVPVGGYVESILENTTIGSEVIVVEATDLDQGENQIITYFILTNTSGGFPLPFSIPDPTVRIASHPSPLLYLAPKRGKTLPPIDIGHRHAHKAH